MRLVDVLARERVSVSNDEEGLVCHKPAALLRLAKLLTIGQHVANAKTIHRILLEREQLQSTGIGGGVAVPHGCLDSLERQIGAVLVCPGSIPFDAIDGQPVGIIFALVGPRGAPAQHLKLLAQVSRLFRQDAFRQRLLQTPTGSAAFDLIAGREGGNG